MNGYQAFVNRLRHQLELPLPGYLAHRQMSPNPRAGVEPDYVPRIPPRRGGVLVLLYPKANAIHLPLILRPTYNGVHSGQISFPGGRQEEIDDSLIDTALREAEEEVGINPSEVEVMGKLSKIYIEPSNFEVYPVVGWMAQPPVFCTDPREVAMLLEAPLADFQDPANRFEEKWNLRGRQVHVPFYRTQDQTVWGATAMILSELLSIVAQ